MFAAFKKPLLNTYSAVATEYYDAKIHPTCQNFRDGSRAFLATSLDKVDRAGITLEVGAGNALLGELSKGNRIQFEQMILLDSSREMLAYSKQYEHMAQLIVGDALSLPFSARSVSLMVASLADPFNIPLFWQEAHRSLKTGGRFIFTVPSYEWASSFRRISEHEFADTAFFQLRSGERIYLPSLVKPEAEQASMMSSFGFRVVKTSGIAVDAIPLPHSPKIMGFKNILTGYIVEAR